MERLEKPPLHLRQTWKNLAAHYGRIRNLHLRELFAEDPGRGERLTVEGGDLFLDYSKNRITDETLSRLLELAEESDLRERIDAMFRGDRINTTEDRAVLHVALRTPRTMPLVLNGKNVIDQVHYVLDRMANFSTQVRSGDWRGFSGKRIMHIVNIGIGGSDLGPAMAYEAMRYYADDVPKVRFIANVDGTDFIQNVADLDPAETLFVVSSKTFGTQETMTNARTARNWILEAFQDSRAISRHFVAVSTNVREATRFGIDPDNIFPFWDWVGGRYSLASAIGISTMIGVGPEHFRAMLQGMHRMDEHFRNAPFDRNLPVLMALLSVWYVDFFNVTAMAVLPYEQYLKKFPAYLQQLIMESNGKSRTIDGRQIAVKTSPVYWGEPGTNGQHSFYQLLHQGTQIIPCDFIAFAKPLNTVGDHHEILLANLLAQAEALAFGKTADEVRSDGTPDSLVPHRVFEGNRPSNIIMAEKLTPETLGQLIALYEHNTFVQGAIWEIDSFDQWGVELGKVLTQRILVELESSEPISLAHDSSTNNLIRKCQKRSAMVSGTSFVPQ